MQFAISRKKVEYCSCPVALIERTFAASAGRQQRFRISIIFICIKCLRTAKEMTRCLSRTNLSLWQVTDSTSVICRYRNVYNVMRLMSYFTGVWWKLADKTSYPFRLALTRDPSGPEVFKYIPSSALWRFLNAAVLSFTWQCGASMLMKGTTVISILGAFPVAMLMTSLFRFSSNLLKLVCLHRLAWRSHVFTELRFALPRVGL